MEYNMLIFITFRIQVFKNSRIKELRIKELRKKHFDELS